LNILMLLDFVLQLDIARQGVRRLFLERGVSSEIAYACWHACLKWWSMRVPAAYLAISLLSWALTRLIPGNPVVTTYGSFIFSISIIFAAVAAMRLLPKRNVPYELSVFSDQHS